MIKKKLSESLNRWEHPSSNEEICIKKKTINDIRQNGEINHAWYILVMSIRPSVKKACQKKIKGEINT